jgi:hypothetical protein
MSLTVAHITPLISLLAGILILIAPALLNYIVAIYLIVAGAVGLNEIYHELYKAGQRDRGPGRPSDIAGALRLLRRVRHKLT